MKKKAEEKKKVVDKKEEGPEQEKTLTGDGKVIAKKAFTIRRNDYRRVILPGDNLKDIPKEYIGNLKTEGVI